MHVDALVEVGLEQADVAARQGREQSRVAVEDAAERRRPVAAAVSTSVGQVDGECHAGARREAVDDVLHGTPRAGLPPARDGVPGLGRRGAIVHGADWHTPPTRPA
jgi:hypothetical protein